MNLYDKYRLGLPYADFLTRHATTGQLDSWRQSYERVALTAAQRDLLAAFRREMPVLCLAGAWCGDCINQCPIFEHFAAAAPVIRVHYLDRDEHADVQAALQINGGNRVPVLVFFSEDGHEVARYGERTLAQYRGLVRTQLSIDAPLALVPSGGPVLTQATQEWLNEFERVQWMLRLSPRLRQRHGD